MKYVQMFDPTFDEVFQIEIDEETFEKISNPDMKIIRDTPWPQDKFPIKSWYLSERHPEFDGWY